MDKLFNKIKTTIKIKSIVALSLALLFIASGIVTGILFNEILIVLGFVVACIVPSLVFIIGKKSFGISKEKVISSAFNEAKGNLNLNFDYYKEQDMDDFILLEADQFSPIYYITSTIYGEINNVKVEAYSFRFKDLAKKSAIGRIIKFEFENDLKVNVEDIKLNYFKDGSYYNNVKIKGNKLYLISSEFQKIKSSRLFSYEPIDFKTYDEFIKNIKHEITFIEKMTNLD